MTEELKDVPELDLISKVRESVLANEDLKIAMLAGCDIESDFNAETGVFTVRTVQKVSILRDKKTNQVISVGVMDTDGRLTTSAPSCD